MLDKYLLYTTKRMDAASNNFTRGFWTALNTAGTLVAVAWDIK